MRMFIVLDFAVPIDHTKETNFRNNFDNSVVLFQYVKNLTFSIGEKQTFIQCHNSRNSLLKGSRLSIRRTWPPSRKDDPISVKIQGLMANRLYQLESGRHHYEQTLRTIIEQHWDENTLLAETERIEALVKPHLALANFDRDEARALVTRQKRWVEWAKNASPEEREEAINSERFRSQSPELQAAIMRDIEELNKDEERDQRKQLAYRFVRSLEKRRRFIRQRRADITTEIANGMPKWETKPADPAVIPSIKTFALGCVIGGCAGCVTGTSFNLAIEFVRWAISLF